MAAGDPYARTVRQTVHDAVYALLTAPSDAPEGSASLREVLEWLVREHGPGALLDVAEELAVDLAETFTVIADAEGRDPLAVLDSWFHDAPVPEVPDAAHRDGTR